MVSDAQHGSVPGPADPRRKGLAARMRQHRRLAEPDPDIFTELDGDPRFPIAVAFSDSPTHHTTRYTIEYRYWDACAEPDATVIKPRTVTHTYTFTITD